MGGGFELTLRSGEHDRVVRGTFHELDPPRRLAFTLELDAGEPSASAFPVEVNFYPHSGQTEMRIVQGGFTSAEQAAGYRAAWYHLLEQLPAVMESELAAFTKRVTRGPRFLSRFGGTWLDLSDAEARIAGKEELGLLDADDSRRLRDWMRDGYLVLENAVDNDVIDRLFEEIEAAWRGELGLSMEFGHGGIRHLVPVEARHRKHPHKVHDLHGASVAARDALFNEPVVRFLSQVFERPPMAFQSLLFEHGTEQGMHQDAAYVQISSPLEFVGCWIALEDIEPGSGELQYYRGSHRIPEYVWFDRTRAKPHDCREEEDFLRWVQEKPEEMGLELVRFQPKRGDVLLWHADLVHGGSQREPEKRNRTRRSLVVHFCPVDVEPEWWHGTSHRGRRLHRPGCYYCAQGV